ncbi:MAG: DUF924 family protein, partial [Pirellulales bacterium]
MFLSPGGWPCRALLQRMDAAEVLDFWFGQDRKRWFEKNDAFDTEIRHRFLPLYEEALQGNLDR